jgi:multidrug efflux system membrane fusion protein
MTHPPATPGHRPVRFATTLVLLAAAAVLAGCTKPPPPLVKSAPPDVIYELPVQLPVTDYEEFTGRTEAYRVVDIRPEVTGKLKTIHFKDGDVVDAWDPLFEIDDRLFAAQRDSAKAALVKADAQLARAQGSLERAEEGYKNGTTGKEELDTKLADRDVERANVEAAKAHLKETETTLDYTRITAPFAGRLGRRMVDPGNTVKAHETILTRLIVLDPIYIAFDIDERTVLRIRRLVQEGKIPSRRDSPMTVRVALADEDRYSFTAPLTFADNVLDLNTGTLRVRAEMNNPSLQFGPLPAVVGAAAAVGVEHKGVTLLSPNMFVRVRLPIGREHTAILVPEEALGSDQGQRFVYVLNKDDEVVRRTVTLGPQEGRLRVVNEFHPDSPGEGVAPGERVIVSGHQRIRPGLKVSAKAANGKVIRDQ